MAEPGEAFGYREESGFTRITLDVAAVRALADTLLPKRGTYSVPSAPALQVLVEPAEIRERDGRLIKTVG